MIDLYSILANNIISRKIKIKQNIFPTKIQNCLNIVTVVGFAILFANSFVFFSFVLSKIFNMAGK